MWAKLTYNRTVKAYRNVLKHMFINRDQNIELTTKDLVARSEIWKRDFTKRQMNILIFIMTYSYSYRKESAYIPKLQDFHLAGIDPSKIKYELEKLIEMNVIDWNRETMEFKLRKPYLWTVPYNRGYNDEYNRSLFLKNLEHDGIDVEPIIQKLKEINIED